MTAPPEQVAQQSGPGLSIIIPASNEAAWIARALAALAASDPVPDGPVQVIVVANGCSDDTAARADAAAPALRARGWEFSLLERAEGGKPAALDAGDGAATQGSRLYLDADVTVSPPLLAQVMTALHTDAPRYVGATPRIASARSAATRAYARFWAQVPFNRTAAPGYGLFAVNPAGRARWQGWPRIISDDTFARLQFTPDERLQVPAAYDWPLPEGLGPLIRVRAAGPWRGADRAALSGADGTRSQAARRAGADDPGRAPWLSGLCAGGAGGETGRGRQRLGAGPLSKAVLIKTGHRFACAADLFIRFR